MTNNKVARDETLQIMAREAAKQTLLMTTIAGKRADSVSDWSELAMLVGEDLASSVFPVGTHFHVPWIDTRTSSTTEYDNELNVVQYQDVTLENGDIKKAMTVQQRYCTPFGTQFSARQAFYAAPSGGLQAGTYNITFSSSWGKMVAGESYQFTLANDLAEGGQLVFASDLYSTAAAGTKVNVFAGPTYTTAIETPILSAGTDGTNLGTLGTTQSNGYDPDGQVNQQHRTVYGDNFWPRSAVRQYLNSSASVATVNASGVISGGWWSAQSKWDRPTSEVTTTAGYLLGWDSDTVDHMAKIAISTALPTCDGGSTDSKNDGYKKYTTTFDRVWLPSAEQQYWGCTWLGTPYGIEGDAFEYWKQVWGKSTPAAMGSTWPILKVYDVANHNSSCSVFARSALRGYGYYVGGVYSSGSLHYNGATGSWRLLPAWSIVQS